MEYPRPQPQPTPTSEPFWSGLRNQQVLLQQCDDCSKWVYYPRSHCPHCLSPGLIWKEVAGAGTLYSFTVARQATAPQFADETPQLIGVVELDEGVRLNTVMINVEPEGLKVGMKVRPVFYELEDSTVLYFEPDVLE
ncbi:MAG: putative OB-fold protein [Porticoccaceae bacterium]|jgi:uncharacterized OB-fold protein